MWMNLPGLEADYGERHCQDRKLWEKIIVTVRQTECEYSGSGQSSQINEFLMATKFWVTPSWVQSWIVNIVYIIMIMQSSKGGRLLIPVLGPRGFKVTERCILGFPTFTFWEPRMFYWTATKLNSSPTPYKPWSDQDEFLKNRSVGDLLPLQYCRPIL